MNKKIKIAVNTRFLIDGKLEGIGLFTLEVLKEMVSLHPEVDFVFLFDRPFDPRFILSNNVTGISLFPPARHPFLWYIWYEWAVRKWLDKNKPDLFLSMDGMTTLNTQTKRVSVIHDLAFEHFKDHVSPLVRKYYRYFVPKHIEASTQLVTVSEFTKQDVIRLYDTPSQKITVVYNAPKEEYKPLKNKESSEIKTSLTEGCNFFLYVGSIHPRKNISNLLLAFDSFKIETKSEVKLVLIGRKAWKFEEVDAILENMTFKNDVHFLGYQSPEKTAKITASALALCYISLFEGFGIPIVEAQQAGVPVITSTVTSMPEVAGNAAILLNPFDVKDIAQAMVLLANDQNLRQKLITKGFENCKRFSWKKSAQKLWEVCEKAMSL